MYYKKKISKADDDPNIKLYKTQNQHTMKGTHKPTTHGSEKKQKSNQFYTKQLD